MKNFKYLAGIAAGASAFAAQAAEETVEHMPDNWLAVQEHPVNNDIPQLLGYASDPSLTMTYNPDAVSAGYLGFLQSSATIGNFIFAAVVLVALLFLVFVLINGRAKLDKGFSGKLIPRWSKLDVFLHWLAGIPGVILILTGLVIGAGRFCSRR